MPVGRRPSDRADTEHRPAGGERRALHAPLRQLRAVRAESGIAAHGAVPDEPPVGPERHAARRPLHEHRTRGPRARATTRCCSATPTRASTRARSPIPTIPDCGPTRVCCPGFTEGLTMPEPFQPWLDFLRAHGHEFGDHVEAAFDPDPAFDATGRGSTWAPAIFPAEHSISAFLTDTMLDHLRPGRRRVVRARELPAPAPAVASHPRVLRSLRPRRHVAGEPPGHLGGRGSPPSLPGRGAGPVLRALRPTTRWSSASRLRPTTRS